MPIQIRGCAPLLQVFDMPTSLAFYQNILDFQLVQGNADWVLLERDGVQLMLNTAYESHERPDAPDPARIAAHNDAALYFDCPNVGQAYDHLTGQGLKIDKPVIRDYGMKQLYLNDPDGYNLCFQWPAHHEPNPPCT